MSGPGAVWARAVPPGPSSVGRNEALVQIWLVVKTTKITPPNRETGSVWRRVKMCLA